MVGGCLAEMPVEDGEEEEVGELDENFLGLATCALSPYVFMSDDDFGGMTDAQQIISRAHWIKCDTSYTWF